MTQVTTHPHRTTTRIVACGLSASIALIFAGQAHAAPLSVAEPKVFSPPLPIFDVRYWQHHHYRHYGHYRHYPYYGGAGPLFGLFALGLIGAAIATSQVNDYYIYDYPYYGPAYYGPYPGYYYGPQYGYGGYGGYGHYHGFRGHGGYYRVYHPHVGWNGGGFGRGGGVRGR